MDLLDYKIGRPLRLDVYNDNGAIIENDFASQFEEPVDAYEALIAAPIVEGVVYAVRVGWSITVYMQDGNDFYRFFARVTQRLQRDGRSLLRITRTSVIDVAQRRQYYRFKYSIPFKYRVITKYEKSRDIPFIDGKTADISGSGLCFTTNDELNKDSLIECELTIKGKHIYLVGRITRCTRNSVNENNQYEYDVGVLFSEIEEHNRDIIIKFIFDEERRRRQIQIA